MSRPTIVSGALASRQPGGRMYQHVAFPLDFLATDAVRAALSGIGRTEDLRFSPDNRLLAIASYLRNVVLLLSVRISDGPAGPCVNINDYAELSSESFGGLHGLDFLDEETLATGNRDGWVSIVRLPSSLEGRRHEVDVLSVMRAGKLRSNLFSRPHSPGSLVAANLPDGQPGLLVVNNYKHRVTRHVLDPQRAYRPIRHRVALWRGLRIPDGIAASPDERWVAVSSHLTHDVKVYDAAQGMNWRLQPAASLPGADYPHGLRFSMDGRRLFVADAGAPYVLIYERGDAWSGVHRPAGRVRIMDEETFGSRRANPSEGGPKGVDVDRSGRLLAITCHQLPLRLYALDRFVEASEQVV